MMCLYCKDSSCFKVRWYSDEFSRPSWSETHSLSCIRLLTVGQLTKLFFCFHEYPPMREENYLFVLRYKNRGYVIKTCPKILAVHAYKRQQNKWDFLPKIEGTNRNKAWIIMNVYEMEKHSASWSTFINTTLTFYQNFSFGRLKYIVGWLLHDFYWLSTEICQVNIVLRRWGVSTVFLFNSWTDSWRYLIKFIGLGF